MFFKFSLFRTSAELHSWQSNSNISQSQIVTEALDWWTDQLPLTEYSITCALEAFLKVNENEKVF